MITSWRKQTHLLTNPFGGRHVALIVETSIHYGRQILRGITRYIRSHQPWSVFLEQRELWTSPPTWLRRWRGDGVICRKTTPALVRMLARAGIPLVDLSDVLPPTGSRPDCYRTTAQIGALAADHLLERGFTNFAFCGFVDQFWSIGRREGLCGRSAARGYDCQVLGVALDRPARTKLGAGAGADLTVAAVTQAARWD